MSNGWAREEFGVVNLGARRLTRRLGWLGTRFADKPTSSIPGACGDWAEAQAVYRFFEQSRQSKCALGWEEILAPDMAQTEARMREHPVVLCLQDCTELDFNCQGIAGLGPLSYEVQRGLYLHPTYAVTPQREPLGLTDAWMWAREPKPKPDSAKRPGLPESLRWIEGYERIAEAAAEMPQTPLVYFADREADILALRQRAHALGMPADCLIRSQHNCALPEGGKLSAKVCEGPALGAIEFTLAARHGQAERSVHQQLWAQRLSLPDCAGGELQLTCLVAKETAAARGAKPIEWRLLTNRTADTLEQAAELIDWYHCRWEIETFFHVLKNGCRVEALQLGSVAKIELALAV